MLGKQWLNLHVEGSLIDRSRHRELKMRGMITWRFKMIMECLPFVMQVSLLLLGYALARYLWDLSRTVSAIIATFTVFGLLFYLPIVFAATAWKTCPFQTPVSVVLRYILSLVNQRKYDRLREIRDRLSAAARFKEINESYFTATIARSIDEELASRAQAPSETLTPATTMVNPGDDESTQASDTNCISTMLRLAGTPDAIVAVTGFIPEVNWTSNIRRVPLLEVYDCLCRSFEFLKDGSGRECGNRHMEAQGHFCTFAYSVSVRVSQMTSTWLPQRSAACPDTVQERTTNWSPHCKFSTLSSMGRKRSNGGNSRSAISTTAG